MQTASSFSRLLLVACLVTLVVSGSGARIGTALRGSEALTEASSESKTADSLNSAVTKGNTYAFVHFESNGKSVMGNTDITHIGGEELPRAEWIQCKRISYGLKRDIGTGARVSGHTHYDRIEFDCPQGPATPMLMQALERGHTVNATIKFFSNRRDGTEGKFIQMNCREGRLADVKMNYVEGEANMIIHYAYHSMQIDHVGEDGDTSAHFDWSGSPQA
uniref:Type VI secretion system tube protein Hcp n=1 Tax=Chromera velia CCMP2878 TaxID=1169474 RepID=A0A0G4GPK9_9ALVE|eukprot:Cvel_22785.t1-p1 / transcript=Cvel_22785.t1 / gene=Cvel_22785 / organism=Chromera_velia_CCMP2878 / gene_product=hypothetical protein / transcript_product=hypothetical protein / location=Cvel_scaffold2279:6921-9127(-) / protein_length=218 / sequence_SO=supercontig / SO=protein_coding / is_pseudo=false